MQILSSVKEMQSLGKRWQLEGQSICLVPTMGALHRGHEKLIARGRELANKLIVSVFVNPAQFGPNEDLAAYPRTLQKDVEKAEKMGADLVFTPNIEDMYGQNHSTWVDSPILGNVLCGEARPGHFKGVCTVVLKLFLLTKANFAVFGQKDWQQLAIIKRMVEDLNLDIQIDGHPIVREEDGLALSSRNVYLSGEDRAIAPHIYKALQLAKANAKAGQNDVSAILAEVQAYLVKNMPEAKADYISIVDASTLQALTILNEDALMACAIRLGKTRLIDNMMLFNN